MNMARSDWKAWKSRVTADVLYMLDDEMLVRIYDNGTRRMLSGTAGTMKLTRDPHNGHWTLAAPTTLATWADADLQKWCKKVGGGVMRTVGLVKAAQEAARKHELVEIMGVVEPIEDGDEERQP